MVKIVSLSCFKVYHRKKKEYTVKDLLLFLAASLPTFHPQKVPRTSPGRCLPAPKLPPQK